MKFSCWKVNLYWEQILNYDEQWNRGFLLILPRLSSWIRFIIREQKKEIEKKLYVGVLILFKLVYVFSRGLIMLLSCFSSNLQILGPHGSLIYKPKCVWNSKFNYSIQLSLNVSMCYGCIPCTQTWYVFGFHNHHPGGFREDLDVVKMIMVTSQIHCN